MAPKKRKSRKTPAENPKKAKIVGYRLKWLKAVSDYVSETQTNVLNLVDKGLRKEEVSTVLNFLSDSQVTELNLQRTSLKNSMVDLAPLLRQTKIKKLNISGCDLTKDDILRLAEVLEESEISELVMGELRFTDRFSSDEASKFISCLQKSKLKTLRCITKQSDSFFNLLFPQTDITSFVQEFLNTSVTCLDLDLNGCSVDVAAIFKSLSHSSVTELRFNSNEKIWGKMQKFSKSLAKSKIEKLALDGDCLTDDALNILVNRLVDSKVTTLTFNKQNFSSLSPLFTKIKETKIRTLGVCSNRWNPRHETFVYPDCLQYSCLATLNLSDCLLNDEQGVKLMDSLTFSNITKLNVGSNFLGILTIKRLANKISNMNLLDLDISNNEIPFEGFSIVGECLKKSKLTRINLSRMNEKRVVPSCNDLLSFLKLAEGSSVSHIEMNGYTDSWYYYDLSVGDNEMLVNTKFTVLDLSASNIQGNNMRDLVRYLKFTSITHLNLSGNRIGDYGVDGIAELLKDSQIRRLNLNRNAITLRGAEALALSLKDSNILFLDLSQNGIDNDGLKVLAESVENSFVTELDVAYNSGKKNLLVDKVLWENKTTVYKLVGFFKQIKPQSDSQEFCFDQNSSDSDVSTFLEKCMEFYKTVIDKPKAINVLLEEESVSYSRAEIHRLLFEELPRQFSSFIACRVEADLTEIVRILEKAEEMGLIAIVQSLLLHRPVFMLDEEQGILHPNVYRLLLKYKQPVCNLDIEPDGVTKIIKYFTEHGDIDSAQDLIKLLSDANIS